MSGSGPPPDLRASHAQNQNESHGIDMLCDAAVSRAHHHPPPLRPNALPHLRSPDPPRQPFLPGPATLTPTAAPSTSLTPTSGRAPAKRKLEDASHDGSPGLRLPSVSAASGASHVCHVCSRVYERADHLTRHLRSHENARPYLCTRCPKRFNRADLLTRHESTHDRSAGTALDVADESGSAGDPLMPRSDRAAKACLNCAAAKSKCEDRKPCSRCRARGVPCEPAHPKGSLSERPSVADSRSTESPHSPPTASRQFQTSPARLPYPNHVLSTTESTVAHRHMSYPLVASHRDVMEAEKVQDHFSMPEAFNDGTMFFGSAGPQFQNFDLWDLKFEDISLPISAGLEEAPGSYSSGTPSSTNGLSTSSRALLHDHSRGYAAFKRSPWLWEPPEEKDSLVRAKEGLALPAEISSPSSSAATPFKSVPDRFVVTPAIRDNIFALVLSQHSGQQKVPSFPSLELLNHLLQVHFVQDLRRIDAMVHRASFDTTKTIAEMVAVIIASGATLISVPEIWKFGLALQEVIRVALGNRFEGANNYTRDLTCIQGYLLMLDIGQWSGFSRKMEIAECFLQPIVTMLRCSRVLTCPSEIDSVWPTRSDSEQVLEEKWTNFIKRESWKRLALRMFAHDAEASIGLCKNPLMKLSELRFDLPASRSLWRAGSAHSWREAYLARRPVHAANIPRVSDIAQHARRLEALSDLVDVDFCTLALLYGHWGRITALAESAKFHRTPEPQPWIQAQYESIYHSLLYHTSSSPTSSSQTRLLFLAEFLSMALNIPFDDLERFAGKHGEDEARLASGTMNATWAGTVNSRRAAWHAGQVFRHARHLPPASLRGFDAIAVYLSGLTLWIYGLLCPSATDQQRVLLDEHSTPEVQSFLHAGHGTPLLRVTASGAWHPLAETGLTLEIARDILRDNYPVTTEPLPPLVESLSQLLVDLGPGKVASRGSNGL